jgi:hypothetical protein
MTGDASLIVAVLVSLFTTSSVADTLVTAPRTIVLVATPGGGSGLGMLGGVAAAAAAVAVSATRDAFVLHAEATAIRAMKAGRAV